MHNAATSIPTNTRSKCTTTATTSCNDDQSNGNKIPRNLSVSQKQRFWLDHFYRDAIEHVCILVLDVKLMMQANTCSTSSTTTTEQGSYIMDHASYKGGVLSDVYHHLKHDNFNNSEGGKKKVAVWMTNWLCQNWINPCTDESGLEQMAKDCGTSKTVVIIGLLILERVNGVQLLSENYFNYQKNKKGMVSYDHVNKEKKVH